MQHYPVLEPVFPYINQHLKENISLADIVSHCDISQGYLSRLFKQNFGITVMDYIHLCKIRQAKVWMNQIHMSIGDISFELGYSEPSYFSKIFRKFEGTPAQEYRHQHFV